MIDLSEGAVVSQAMDLTGDEEPSDEDFKALLSSIDEADAFYRWGSRNDLAKMCKFHYIVTRILEVNDHVFTLKSCRRLLLNQWKRGTPILVFLSNVGNRIHKEIQLLSHHIGKCLLVWSMFSLSM